MERESSSSNSTTASSDSDSYAETQLASTSSQEWDKVLDDYESYVGKTIKIMKKMKNDDLTALAEYPALIEKSKDLEESLQNAQNSKSLSSKQVGRMMKIQTKMLQAMQEMD